MASEGYSEEDGATSVVARNSTKWDRAIAAIPVFVFPWIERLNDETGEPEVNTEGLVNFFGLIGTVAATVILFTALPLVRRKFYRIFYNVHVPAAAIFIIMAAFHNFPMQIFVIPGLVSYVLDRTDCLGRTSTSSRHPGTAVVTVLTDEWVRLDVHLSPHGGHLSGKCVGQSIWLDSSRFSVSLSETSYCR